MMPLTRRTALKGFGTAIALPWLETLARAAAPVAAAAPKRVAFIYVPNGIASKNPHSSEYLKDFLPSTAGKLGELPDILKALEPHKEYLNVFGGLALDKAKANG